MTCDYSDIAADLRAWVLKTLGHRLGKYKWTTGATTKAITIVGNQQTQHPPSGVEVSGLEVVIFYPEPDSEILMGSYMSLDKWSILLKQWNATETTLTAKNILLSNSRYPVTMQLKIEGNAPMSIPEMYRLTITIPNYLTTNT